MTKYEVSTCPVCHGEQYRVLADHDAVRRELEALWQFHLRRLKTGAPVEQLFDRAIFSQDPPLQVVQCQQCGLVFRNPRERGEEVVETYAQESPSEAALASLFDEQLAFYRPRAAKLTRLARGPASVLEVGSYVGGFLRAAQEAGWRARGIDVNEHANAFARARGCHVDAHSLAEFDSNEKYTAVVLWNCFDQLPDPHAALQHVNELIEPGGWLALRVPNGGFYAHVRSREAGLQRALLAWNNLASFPYRHGFTSKSLRALLDRYGYRVVEQRADTLVSIAGPYTRGWARWEERIVKAGMKLLLPFRFAPWLEVYARRERS